MSMGQRRQIHESTPNQANYGLSPLVSGWLFKWMYPHLKDKEITGGKLGMVLEENKKAEENKKEKQASHDVALAHIDGHFPYQSFLGDKMLFKSFNRK